MEFGEWLFVNEYPVADALDQVINYFSCQVCVRLKLDKKMSIPKYCLTNSTTRKYYRKAFI